MSSSKALSVDQVKIWAETLGIHNLPEDAADFIATSVNQKVVAIVDRANKNANMSRRMKILKGDIDSAMQFLNLEPTVDIGVGDYIPIRGVSGVGGRTLFVLDDKDRDLQMVAKKHTGPVPSEVTLRQHWLAVEGKQPTVPENPSPLTRDEQKSKAANPLIARKVATDRAVRKSQMVSIKDLATSDLSAEQQQYYKDITEAVIGAVEEKRREALSSLELDPGLHGLIPRLAVFISEGVKVNVVQQNLALLIYIMRMVRVLLDNQSVYLQPYLHLIIPAVTSCIVSKMLCSRPEVDNHWALRGFAARILSSICKVYDSPTNRMSQRLIQIFKESLDDESSSLATRFGAYCALIELGNETISLMVIPRVKHEAEMLRNCLTNSTNPADKKAAEQIKEKFAQRLSEHCRQVRPGMDKIDEFRNEFGPILGPVIYEQFVRDRLKDPLKLRGANAAPVRMISPQTSVSSTGSSPGPRHPAAQTTAAPFVALSPGLPGTPGSSGAGTPRPPQPLAPGRANPTITPSAPVAITNTRFTSPTSLPSKAVDGDQDTNDSVKHSGS